MKSEDWFEYESFEHRMLINLNNVAVVYYEKETGTCTVASRNITITTGKHLYNELKKHIEEN